jgi:hypothetical protein
MPSLTAVFTALLIAVAPVKRLPGDWLDETELKAAFAGITVDGEYPNKRSFHEIYHADGSVAYEDDGRTSGGHWSIKAGSFCTIYDDDPLGGCFRVQKAGPNCYEFYFIARTEENAEKDPSDKPSWTARAWHADAPAACHDKADV